MATFDDNNTFNVSGLGLFKRRVLVPHSPCQSQLKIPRINARAETEIGLIDTQQLVAVILGLEGCEKEIRRRR